MLDRATTAENLYVDLTRGREQNLDCVACEPLDDGHRQLPGPSAPTTFLPIPSAAAIASNQPNVPGEFEAIDGQLSVGDNHRTIPSVWSPKLPKSSS